MIGTGLNPDHDSPAGRCVQENSRRTGHGTLYFGHVPGSVGGVLTEFAARVSASFCRRPINQVSIRCTRYVLLHQLGVA
jgi:hypothetical protein